MSTAAMPGTAPAKAASPCYCPNLQSHLPALDGIRGLAILLVMFHHFSFVDDRYRQAGRLGWIGVDLFFVLSGFLITGILYDTKHDPHYFRSFYVRRALRILPLYYAFVLLR